MPLSREQFKACCDLLSPQFNTTPDERRAFATRALYGSPVLDKITWTGGASVFTTNLVRTVDEYDDVPDLLIDLLTTLREDVGESKAAAIDALTAELAPAPPPTSKPSGTPETPATASPPGAHIFISYSRRDLAFVDHPNGFENPDWWRDMPEGYQKQSLSDARQPYTNYPRDSVSWYQAVAFTRWLSAELGYAVRLPTEWEWQWAAQGGSEAREYPWGVWDGHHCNTSESGIGRSTAVGMYPHGAAECGALDMAGNLREWCLNRYDEPEVITVDDSGTRRVLRGGSWDFYRSYACAAVRGYGNPGNRGYGYGFRLVRPVG